MIKPYYEEDLFFNFSGYPLENVNYDRIREAFSDKDSKKFPSSTIMTIRCYMLEHRPNDKPRVHVIHTITHEFEQTEYPLKHFNIEEIITVLEEVYLSRYVKNHNYTLIIDVEHDDDTKKDINLKYKEASICTVKDILDLAERLKSSNLDQKVIFVDSDFNQYFVNKQVKLEVIGEALKLDRETMEENDSNYDEDCIVLEIL